MSCVEILIPSVMAFGGGAFGRGLGRVGGALVKRINDLKKENPGGALTPSAQ